MGLYTPCGFAAVYDDSLVRMIKDIKRDHVMDNNCKLLTLLYVY